MGEITHTIEFVLCLAVHGNTTFRTIHARNEDQSKEKKNPVSNIYTSPQRSVKSD